MSDPSLSQIAQYRGLPYRSMRMASDLPSSHGQDGQGVTYPPLLSLFTFASALSGLVGPPGATVLHEQGAIFLDSAPYGLLACALLGL